MSRTWMCRSRKDEPKSSAWTLESEEGKRGDADKKRERDRKRERKLGPREGLPGEKKGTAKQHGYYLLLKRGTI